MSIKSAARTVSRCKNWGKLLDEAERWTKWAKSSLSGEEKKRALLHLKRIRDIADVIIEEDLKIRRMGYVAPDRTETVET